MKISMLTGGVMAVNCYFLTDEETRLCAVIDPGFDTPALEAALNQAGPDKVALCLLTHGHFDHISGVARVRAMTQAKICMHPQDAEYPKQVELNLANLVGERGPEPFEPDILMNDNDTVKLGNLTITAIHTPGHTAGGCCYVAQDAIFSGDTLMQGTVGRMDFPTGSYPQMMESLKKLAALPGDYRVFPGHGEDTTLTAERLHNSFLKTGNPDDFDY